MKDEFNNYFLNITKEDIKHHKTIVRRVRKNRDELLRREVRKIKETV